MSTIDVGMRLGDAIDPFHLANGFEAVIGYECQERSNHPSLTPTMHTIHARCDKASEWVGGSLQCRRGILVILWMSLFGETFHAYPRLIRWTFPQFIEREIPDTFDDSSTSTTCLYLSPSQLCLMKRESNFTE